MFETKKIKSSVDRKFLKAVMFFFVRSLQGQGNRKASGSKRHHGGFSQTKVTTKISIYVVVNFGQISVTSRADNAIQRINRYPADK